MNNPKNNIKGTLKFSLLLLLWLNLCGWTFGTAPLDESGDAGDIINGVVSCASAANTKNSTDNGLYVYKKGADCNIECHRWGVKWQGLWIAKGAGTQKRILKELSNTTWADVLNEADSAGDGSAFRLATIKELVRIFDYSNLAASDPAVPVGHAATGSQQGTVFRSWLQENTANSAFVSGYLISSTYRNIANDGGDVGDASPKILGIEIETGKVVAFNQDLTLCEELSTSGGCEVSTDVNVYAFKVSELP